MVLARLAVRNALNGSPGTGVLCRGPRRAKTNKGRVEAARQAGSSEGERAPTRRVRRPPMGGDGWEVVARV